MRSLIFSLVFGVAVGLLNIYSFYVIYMIDNSPHHASMVSFLAMFFSPFLAAHYVLISLNLFGHRLKKFSR